MIRYDTKIFDFDTISSNAAQQVDIIPNHIIFTTYFVLLNL
jgi:hypothetical protein